MKRLLPYLQSLMIVSLLSISISKSFCQDQEPKGQPILKVYWNFHKGITPEDRSAAFEVRRVYLGYEYYMSEHLTAVAKLDIGSPEDLSENSLIRRYAYFRNAGLFYKKNGWDIRVGLIDQVTFKTQEDFWAHRYLYKSLQDEHKFGNSADIGFIVLRELAQNLSIDLSIANGEGYKDLQTDNQFKTGIGLTYEPFQFLQARIYYDFIRKEAIESTFNTFAGFTFGPAKLGLEYNLKANNDDVEGRRETGLSFYSMYQFNAKWEVFGRHDRVFSNLIPELDLPWNLAKDGTAVIAGIQFHPMKRVKMALSYKDWYPMASNLPNVSYIYFNLEFVY